MPKSYKRVGYVSISFGLLFLSFAVVFGFYSVNVLEIPLALYAMLGFPIFACGLGLFLWGFKHIWADYLEYCNSQLKAREEIQEIVSGKIVEIKKLTGEVENSGTYLIYSSKNSVLSKIADLRKEVNAYTVKKMLKADFANNTEKILDDCTELISDYNQKFIQQRKKDYCYLWEKDKILLDDEQQTAIVTDDKYNLVVAAAGSGKTEVLITRIAYLIQRSPDGVDPKRILAIAYQRKAREQIEQRLQNGYGIEDVFVRTFHKLGKDILERSGKTIYRTDIVDENRKYEFVKSFFEEEVRTNPAFYQLFIRYIVTVCGKDSEATENDKEAVVAHAKERSYISINGIKVNSRAEKEIMDWLLTHKINGEPIDVRYEPDVGCLFRPDFHLPQFDVFIEHWGLKKDGEVPEWFNQSTSEYKDAMEKKKNWFAEHGKHLVETFAYEYTSDKPQDFGELLKNRIQKTLEKRFPERHFEFSRLNYEEILELVWDSQKTPIDDIQNFITIAKTYGFNPEQIAEKLEKGRWSTKQLAFGRLALHVFQAYQAQLERLGKTDFEDMINEATAALENDKSLYANLYDQILIDEYQDISAQRFKLLKKLLDRNPNCRLFCVGDDWQSIMGFSGSNLNFFVNFGEYFMNPAISRICTNYRSIKTLVDAGAELIKNNGANQLQKPALSKNKETRPIFVYNSSQIDDELYREQTVQDCLSRISEYLEKGFAAHDILVLTRYMRTKIKGRTEFFKIVRAFLNSAKQRGVRVVEDRGEGNGIRLLTVHKCKGLEAKVVFVLNVVKGEFGFPSEIEDPAILEVARGDNGIHDQKEEERRLFYVAVTRAKEDLYIYTKQKENSEFLTEIASYTTLVHF
ncbi:MAG TPA: UvrD-helicase domain-containing protein [Candidatus Bathyarchaeia archaeon]|nr:UvrD-helicase domain-containing protein [Candidatus Bathyarchaeia archaeon]